VLMHFMRKWNGYSAAKSDRRSCAGKKTDEEAGNKLFCRIFQT